MLEMAVVDRQEVAGAVNHAGALSNLLAPTPLVPYTPEQYNRRLFQTAIEQKH